MIKRKCAVGESNPGPSRGRRRLYHLTNRAGVIFVNLKIADGLDAPELNSSAGTTTAEDPMDIPVDIELRLKKTKIQKRKFVPSVRNYVRRKKAKQ